MTKVIDGQNISLADAICRCGFKRLDDQQFELTDGNKKFVLSNLVGVVKEIQVLEENIQAAGSANGQQEIKHQKQINKKDDIQLAADPIEKKDLDEENQTKALEQNGFHIIGEDGYQTSSTDYKQTKKSNKKSYSV